MGFSALPRVFAFAFRASCLTQGFWGGCGSYLESGVLGLSGPRVFGLRESKGVLKESGGGYNLYFFKRVFNMLLVFGGILWRFVKVL